MHRPALEQQKRFYADWRKSPKSEGWITADYFVVET